MSIEKFLAIAFMCHRKPERSFFLGERQFPLCARCTGIAVGYVLGIVIAFINERINSYYFLLLNLPMIIDGLIQHFYKIESTNTRRFVTGIMGGVGIIYGFINLHLFTVWWVGLVLEYVFN